MYAPTLLLDPLCVNLSIFSRNASMERKRRSSSVRKVSSRMVWSANLRLFHRTGRSAFACTQASRSSPPQSFCVSHLPLPPINAAFSGGVHVSYLQVTLQVSLTTSSSTNRSFRNVPPRIVHARPFVSPVPDHLLLRRGRSLRHRRARARADLVPVPENILWFGRTFAWFDRTRPGFPSQERMFSRGQGFQMARCGMPGTAWASARERGEAVASNPGGMQTRRTEPSAKISAFFFFAGRKGKTKVGCL